MTTIDLVPKKNTNSAIWNYFGLQTNSENVPIAGAEDTTTSFFGQKHEVIVILYEKMFY